MRYSHTIVSCRYIDGFIRNSEPKLSPWELAKPSSYKRRFCGTRKSALRATNCRQLKRQVSEKTTYVHVECAQSSIRGSSHIQPKTSGKEWSPKGAAL